jgi:hypothetical protein
MNEPYVFKYLHLIIVIMYHKPEDLTTLRVC